MNEFHGIILYEIERNGNLNGVYTNNHPFTNSRIFTETATLRGEVSFDGEIETRIYDCFYFDAVDGATNCTLIFRIINGIYQAQWRLDNGDVRFVGEGFQMNDRQIAISYWLP